MKRVILALILATVLTLTFAAPVLAKEPPDDKPLPENGIQGLIYACWGISHNMISYLKDNPSLFSWGSAKLWTNTGLLGYGTPIAWGHWLKKP